MPMHKIAVIMCQKQLSQDSEREIDAMTPNMNTRESIASVFATEPKFAGSEIMRVAWDGDGEEIDWTAFTHILMSDELHYVDCIQQLLQWIESLPQSVQERFVNPLPVIKWNISKKYLQQFQASGIRIADTVFITSTSELGDVIRQLKEEGTTEDLHRLVIKNIVDADGTSTALISLNDLTKAQQVFSDALRKSSSGVMVQRYLTAIEEEGEWSVIYLGGQLSHGVHKTPRTGDFRVQSRHGGQETAIHLHNLPKDILCFANEVMSAVPAHLPKLVYGRVDIVRNHKGLPCLMEFEAFEPSLYLFTPQLRANLVKALISS